MSHLASIIMPQLEVSDYGNIDSIQSSPSSSSSYGSTVDSASSQSSYSSQSTDVSVERLDESVSPASEDIGVARSIRKAHTFHTLSQTSDSRYMDNQPAQWIQAQSRVHPRRTASLSMNPPSLARSAEKKDQFVNNLVDAATCMVEVIWPLAACDRHNLPLRTYIQEILKRTKTSFSTLQVALFYLLLVKVHVPQIDFTREQPRDLASIRGFQCGRRMFLASIILASKYLQDRNYSSKAWSKITSLPVEEINANERAFLNAVEWKLHLPEPKFERWQKILIEYSQPAFADRWRGVVRVLRPELDNLPALSAHSRPMYIDTSVPPVSSYLSPMVSSPGAFMSAVASPMTPIRVNTPPTVMNSPMSSRLPPFAPRIERLATPQCLEPPTPFVQTPAVSFGGNCGRPSAMRTAFSLANSACLARSVRDCGSVRSLAGFGAPGFPTAVRCQSSLASSPESMISDSSSQASRSSSISSMSGASVQSENALRLAHLAQMNNLKAAMQPVHTAILTSSPEDIVIEESPSPSEFEVAHSRKRARSGCSIDYSAIPTIAEVDSALQLKTRSLLRAPAQKSEFNLQRQTAANVVPLTNAECLAKLASLHTDMPPQKRYRVADEYSTETWRPEGGPGMWKNILY